MFEVILYQPEIPPNTGNIIRLCANTGARLHLVRPLGFALDDKHLRRAGLDYHEYAALQVHDSLQQCLQTLASAENKEKHASLNELFNTRRVFAFTTKATRPFHEANYRAGDVFLFGPESRGLPQEVLDALAPEQRLRLPMLPHSRSLNLSNTVAVAVFEAWRQCGYAGCQPANSSPG